MQVHGDGEEPCPESGDGGRVQAKKMPPFCEVVETLRQDLVYCGWSVKTRMSREPDGKSSGFSPTVVCVGMRVRIQTSPSLPGTSSSLYRRTFSLSG